MTTEATQGATAPVSDANASQPQVSTEVEPKAPGSEAGSSPAATEPSDKVKPKGADQRFGELTRRWNEEKRRSDRLLRQNEELMQRILSQHPQQQPTQPKTLKDFNYDEAAFLKHANTETASTATDAVKATLAQVRAEEVAKQRRAKFDERLTAFTSTVQDYDEVVTDMTPVSKDMAEAIQESEIPGEILYYLGNNLDVATKLYQLPLAAAAKEIGRLEERLIAERKKASGTSVTKAPPPVPKVEAKDPGNVESDPNKMSQAQFNKWRESYISKR